MTTSINPLHQDIKRCKIEGNKAYLPSKNDTPLNDYAKLKKSFLNAGAKYSKNSFIFPSDSDASIFIDRILNGSINIKKEDQVFGTPATLAERLVKMASIQPTDIILEPSAGHGAIVDAIRQQHPNEIFCCEKSITNQPILNKKYHVVQNIFIMHPLNDDFLEMDESTLFDKIIANPPFNKNQDIDHIKKMWHLLKPGGRIVTIASTHWTFSNGSKEIEFREWINRRQAEMHIIEKGAFKESGTNIAAVILIINKPTV